MSMPFVNPGLFYHAGAPARGDEGPHPYPGDWWTETLPLRSVSSSKGGPHAGPAAKDGGSFVVASSPRRVLVVDDDVDFADSLADYLDLHGYTVRTASEPGSAELLLEDFEPMVALVDVRLGRHSGLRLIETLKHRRPELTCIVVTAYPEIETAVEAVRQVVYDYLKKPLHTEEVLTLLSRCFDQRRLQQEKQAALAAVRASERNYRALMEQASDGIFVTDRAGICTDVNAAGRAILGRSKGDILGVRLAELVLLDERGSATADPALLRDAGTARVERWARHLREGLRPVEISSTVLSDGRLQATVREISERKKAEEALKAHARDLETLNRIILAGNEADSVQGFMESAADSVLELLGFSACCIHLLANGGVQLRLSRNLPERLLVGSGGVCTDKEPFKSLFERGVPLSSIRDEGFASGIEKFGFTAAHAYPISSGAEVIGMLCVADRTRAELTIRERYILTSVGQQLGIVISRLRAEERIKEQMREKDVLLREIHHRVKNNLQIVSSLQFLQSKRVTDEKARETLTEGQNRIQSMALIHEKLYRNGDLSRIDLAEYIGGLAAHLLTSYGRGDTVRINTHVEGVSLGVDRAVPCGLIVNELISNALKHAFPGASGGALHVNASADAAGEVLLIVADDGVGLPAGFDYRKVESLGLQLVTSLVKQLGGTIEVPAGPGTSFRIRFSA